MLRLELVWVKIH